MCGLADGVSGAAGRPHSGPRPVGSGAAAVTCAPSRPRLRLGRLPGAELRAVNPASEEFGGDFPYLAVAVLRHPAQQPEGLFGGDAEFGVQDTFGLLDDRGIPVLCAGCGSSGGWCGRRWRYGPPCRPARRTAGRCRAMLPGTRSGPARRARPAGGAAVGAQRQHDAAAEPGRGGRLAERRPAALASGVFDMPGLVVTQGLHHRSLAWVEVQPMQLVDPRVSSGEGQRVPVSLDGHRRGSAAGDQLDSEAGQAEQGRV